MFGANNNVLNIIPLIFVAKHLNDARQQDRVEGTYTPYSKMAANKLFFCLHVY